MKLSNEKFKEIESLLDEYAFYLDEYSLNSSEYKKQKEILNQKYLNLDIFFQNQCSDSEIDFGNIIIENNIMICIMNNEIKKYKLVHKKAEIGDIVYIVNANNFTPFNKNHIGKFYKVLLPVCIDTLKYVNPCVAIKINDVEDVGWLLYDSQYLVLEIIN